MCSRLWISPGSCCSGVQTAVVALCRWGAGLLKICSSAQSGGDCGLGGTRSTWRSWSYPWQWMWDVWQLHKAKSAASESPFSSLAPSALPVLAAERGLLLWISEGPLMESCILPCNFRHPHSLVSSHSHSLQCLPETITAVVLSITHEGDVYC